MEGLVFPHPSLILCFLVASFHPSFPHFYSGLLSWYSLAFLHRPISKKTSSRDAKEILCLASAQAFIFPSVSSNCSRAAKLSSVDTPEEKSFLVTRNEMKAVCGRSRYSEFCSAEICAQKWCNNLSQPLVPLAMRKEKKESADKKLGLWSPVGECTFLSLQGQWSCFSCTKPTWGGKKGGG